MVAPTLKLRRGAVRWKEMGEFVLDAKDGRASATDLDDRFARGVAGNDDANCRHDNYPAAGAN